MVYTVTYAGEVINYISKEYIYFFETSYFVCNVMFSIVKLSNILNLEDFDILSAEVSFETLSNLQPENLTLYHYYH